MPLDDHANLRPVDDAVLTRARAAGAAPEIPLREPRLSRDDWSWVLVALLEQDGQQVILNHAVTVCAPRFGSEHTGRIRDAVDDLPKNTTNLDVNRAARARLARLLSYAVPGLDKGSDGTQMLMQLAAEATGTIELLLECLTIGIDVPAHNNDVWLTLALSGMDLIDAGLFARNSPAPFTPAMHRLAVYAHAHGALSNLGGTELSEYHQHCADLDIEQTAIAVMLVVSGVSPADAADAAQALHH